MIVINPIMRRNLLHCQALAGGLKVGIVGIGGLGQMGVILAKAMGKQRLYVCCGD